MEHLFFGGDFTTLNWCPGSLDHYTYCQFRFGSDSLNKKDGERLSKSIQNFLRQNRAVSKDNERMGRFKGLVDRYMSETPVGVQLIKQHLATGAGKSLLNSYVEQHRDTLLASHLSAIEADANSRKKQYEKEIKALDEMLRQRRVDVETAREKTRQEIEQINRDGEDEKKAILRQQEEELSAKVDQKQQELVTYEERISQVCKTLNIAEETAKLSEIKTYLTYQNNELEQAQANLRRAITGFEEQLKNPERLAERLGEMDAVSRVLRGGTVVTNETVTYQPVTFSKQVPDTAGDLVDQIRNHFDQDNGRSFSYYEMTNLLVSITQSFLTVIAGAPGIGKTSSVIRLAQALGLGSIAGDSNMLYMPVSRGWVSGRDILGFYNSLNGVYQRARTGLYDFLERPSDPNAQAFRFVLLDEANLSPMEHYWSDFLGMCDPEGRHRPIDTGMPEATKRHLNVPAETRFVATINHDSTTERLSKRLIDRVPVITLDHDSGEDSSPETDLLLDGAISYDLCKKFFLNHDEAGLPRAQKVLLDKIMTLLNQRNAELGHPVGISQRKVAAITHYVVVAGAIMEDYDAAFDYAISQHILPHIEGHGVNFRNRIEALARLVKDDKFHPRSADHIERILNSGSEFAGTYSFF